MDVVYTLMMYGLAAVMIFFIATITAGIILGTLLMLASLVHNVRGARRVTSASTIDRPQQGPTEARI
jgi:hypothetical protein